jgi:hypothetical protein
MGLDTSHDCWHGPYSAFMRWRVELAEAAGIPLLLMEGFYSSSSQELWFLDGLDETRQNTILRLLKGAPISWDILKHDAVHELLHHSDCDGEIKWEVCGDMADSLEELLPKMKDKHKTQCFIDGLRLAHGAKENVDFH